MNGRSQIGIVGLASVDDYLNDIIKKHENTREEKEIDRIKHDIVFEVSKDLTLFSRYLSEEIIKKIMKKEENGEIVEKLDI